MKPAQQKSNRNKNVFYEIIFCQNILLTVSAMNLFCKNPVHKNHETQHCHKISDDSVDLLPLKV